jgi:hypothetical protein
MKTEFKVRKVRTTIGDLIVAIMDAALEVSKSERKAYRLTGLVVNKMLQPAPVVVTQPRGNFLRKNWLH